MNWKSRFVLVNAGFGIALTVVLIAGYVKGITLTVRAGVTGLLLGAGMSTIEYRFKGFSFGSSSFASALLGVVPLLVLLYIFPSSEAAFFAACFSGSVVIANLVYFFVRRRRVENVPTGGG